MATRIAVDARMLSRQLNGMGRYTLKICAELLKTKGISLYLYSPAPLLDQYLCELEGAFIKTCNIHSRVLQHAWGETYLPIWASNDKVDVFWGPAHRIPRFLPKNIPRVVTIHDLVWKYARSTMPLVSFLLERMQMPFAINNCDYIVTVSNTTAKSISDEFNIAPNKLAVTALGASLTTKPNSVSSLQKLGISSPYFLFVGTLEPRKNLAMLLAAYSNLPDSIKLINKFVIVGGTGWGGVDLKNMINRLNLDAHIVLLGHVDDMILTTLYTNASFLVMPSIYEGFGLPLIEAMNFGTPVLTSNNSSMPEVAGNAGLFVDAQDVNSITDGLHQMISNTELRNKLASHAKSNATRFNWDKSTTQLLTVFKEAIATRHSRHH